MDMLLVLEHNLVELDCRTQALNHIFSTWYDTHREFHVHDQVDQLMSKFEGKIFFVFFQFIQSEIKKKID